MYVCILMETLHYTFSSNENKDAAASSFDFLFCGSGLDAPILAIVWQHYSGVIITVSHRLKSTQNLR